MSNVDQRIKLARSLGEIQGGLSFLVGNGDEGGELQKVLALLAKPDDWNIKDAQTIIRNAVAVAKRLQEIAKNAPTN